MNILLIDADNDFRRNLTTRLAKRGHSVREAGDAPEARRLAGETQTDVILAGLSSARDPLLTLLAEIRQDRSNISVVLINHSGEVSLSIEAMKLGVADEVGVPVDLEDLLAKLLVAGSDDKGGI